MTLDAELLDVRHLLTAACRVASPITRQVAAEVTPDEDRIVLRSPVLNRPQLLLAQRRSGRIDLETESFGREVAASAVQ